MLALSKESKARPLRRLLQAGGLFLFLFLFAGCAAYHGRIKQPRQYFESGQYDKAIAELTKLAEKKDNDELLYLMDLGTVYHNAGRYQDAINVFLKADKLAEIKDYTSLTQEAASVMLSDEVKPYKGEDFEKILINMYLAIDYTLLHKWEDALVECRRVNQKLDMMISKGGLPYEQNAFAKYLAASLFEAQKEYNDAFVDYRTVLKWRGAYPYLGAPLLRMADKLRAEQEFDEYRKQFGSGEKYKIAKNEGEIVLLVEQGKTPVKEPSPTFRLLPHFVKRGYISDAVVLRNDSGTLKAKSQPLFDIESTAIRELDGRIALIAAKKIAGYAAKEIVANQVAKQTKSEAAGILTSFILHATDTADLRSWSTLPAKLHIARLVVPAGRNDLVVDTVTRGGGEIKNVKRFENIQVKPGETVFLNFRTRE